MNMTLFQPMYRGIVSDTQDPDKLGRVKVKLETLGDDTESDWLPVLQPFAGQESGTFLLPETKDQVIVAYLDPRHLTGFVIGSVWDETNTPPSTGENSSADLNGDGKNNLKFIKTKSGQQIILDDTSGKEKITLLSASAKTRFEMDAGKKLLTLETDKDITITAKGKISITAKEMTVETTKATSLKAAGMGLESTSKKIGLKASQDIEATGGTIKLN